MTIYVSESLKNKVTKEQLENDDANVVNYPDCMFLEVFDNIGSFFATFKCLKNKKNKVILEIVFKEDTKVADRILLVNMWKKINVCVNSNGDSQKIVFYEFKGPFMLKKIEKLISSVFNYKVTIFINKK
jgi:hypothetical protein